MLIHQVPVDAAFATLRSGPDGLSPVEAAARRLEFGPNRIVGLPTPSAAARLVAQFAHFFAVILWVASLLALLADWHMPGQGMATLGFAIIAVIVINGVFSAWQEHRAEQTISALQRLLPRQVRAQRGDTVSVVPSDDVVPGDVIFLSAGEKVPADCRLLEAFGVRVNTASLTGEARPISRDAHAAATDDLLASRNVVLAGTSLTAGEAKALVFATGMRTAFGAIAHMTQRVEQPLSPLQREIAGMSRVIAVLAVAIGLLVFLSGRFVGLPTSASVLFAIGIIVANVPEGLLPTVTLAMAMGARRMARRNTLVRHLPCVEALGSASVICTDKTGTLTQNRMEPRAIYVPGRTLDPGAVRDAAFAGAHHRFLECALQCHDLRSGTGAGAPPVGDPMEIALVQLAESAAMPVTPSPRHDQIPFEPDRKRLVTVHRTPDGMIVFVKGALEELMSRARFIECDGRPEALTPDHAEGFDQAATALADRGLRVLAFAYRTVAADYALAEVEQDLILTALVGFEDPLRPEVPAAVRACRDAGIKTIMITGDHPHTALSVARQAGLVSGADPRLITGVQLARMSDTEVQLALDDPDIVCARVTAAQKLRIVTALQRKQHVVAVTGDGVNDAPALRVADIGIAMGISGTEVAREAADMILLDDNFASIVAAIEEGRTIFENIRKFMTYILTSNVPELVPYLAFAFARVPLALTVMQILAVDLGTDLLPALGLGAEPPDASLMRRPPRRRDERLLTAGVLVRSYLFLGLFEAVAAMGAFFFVLRGSGWQWGGEVPPGSTAYMQATTACLTAIVLMQVVNVHLCRSRGMSVFSKPLFSNRIIVAGIAAELVLLLLIVYSQAGHALFGTAAIDVRAWLVAVPFAIAMVVFEEIRKAVMRRRGLSVVHSVARYAQP